MEVRNAKTWLDRHRFPSMGLIVLSAMQRCGRAKTKVEGQNAVLRTRMSTSLQCLIWALVLMLRYYELLVQPTQIAWAA